MSIYRRKGQTVWSYDFRIRGHRFCGSTQETDERAARRVLKRLKSEAALAARSGTRPAAVPTFAEAANTFWQAVGQYHANAATTLTDIERLQARIGAETRIDEIDDRTVAHLVALRRGDGVRPATVNRSVTQLLRHLLRKTGRGLKLPAITWSDHMLAEPQERVRELTGAEEDALFAALRPDYAAFFAFAMASGCRRQECLDLAWADIDWRGRSIRITGKGNRTRILPLTTTLEAILKPLPRAHARVFTYEAARGEGKGQDRRPMTASGVITCWRRTCASLGLADLHIHDLRHTAATRLLRATGNLRLAKEMLGHADIQTTMKYAHTTREDLAAGMDKVPAPGANITAGITASAARGTKKD